MLSQNPTPRVNTTAVQPTYDIMTGCNLHCQYNILSLSLKLLNVIVRREIYIRSEKDIILICDKMTGCTFVDKR